MPNPNIVLLTANLGSYDSNIFRVPSDWKGVSQIIFKSTGLSSAQINQRDNIMTISIKSEPSLHRHISRIIKINPLFLFDFKVLPPSLFPHSPEVTNEITEFVGGDFGYIIWHDANCLIHNPSSLLELCSKISDNGWGIFNHPDRNCLYKEAKAAKSFAYVNNSLLHQQVAFYRSQRMPNNYGLYACNFFIRSFKSLYSSQILWHSWLIEYLRWVPRDQISLPYCLFHHPLHRPVSLGAFTWTNNCFAFKPH